MFNRELFVVAVLKNQTLELLAKPRRRANRFGMKPCTLRHGERSEAIQRRRDAWPGRCADISSALSLEARLATGVGGFAALAMTE
ncbi:MAG: hypothetical protein ACLPN5_22010 [Roseiarcus sp.]